MNIPEKELVKTIFSASLTLLAIIPAVLGILVSYYYQEKVIRGIKDEYLKPKRVNIYFMLSALISTFFLAIMSIIYLLGNVRLFNLIFILLFITIIVIVFGVLSMVKMMLK